MGLVGLVPLGQDEVDDGNVESDEAWIRSLFGTKLRSNLVVHLLTKPYEALAGRTVFQKYRSDWSVEELIVVTKAERQIINELFRKSWRNGNEVTKLKLSNCIESYVHVMFSHVSIQLKANYTTTTLSKSSKNLANRMPVKQKGNVSLKILYKLNGNKIELVK